MRDNTKTGDRVMERSVLVHVSLEPDIARLLETWRQENSRSRSNACNYIIKDWLLDYQAQAGVEGEKSEETA